MGSPNSIQILAKNIFLYQCPPEILIFEEVGKDIIS